MLWYQPLAGKVSCCKLLSNKMLFLPILPLLSPVLYIALTFRLFHVCPFPAIIFDFDQRGLRNIRQRCVTLLIPFRRDTQLAIYGNLHDLIAYQSGLQ